MLSRARKKRMFLGGSLLYSKSELFLRKAFFALPVSVLPYSWVEAYFFAYKYRFFQIDTWTTGQCIQFDFPNQKLPLVFSFSKNIKKLFFQNPLSKNIYKEKNQSGNFFNPPPPPQTEKKIPQKGDNFFSFFEIFTAECSHFLVTKKTFFLSPKSDYTLQWKFRKTKKVVPFLGYFFFSLGGGIKKFFCHYQLQLPTPFYKLLRKSEFFSSEKRVSSLIWKIVQSTII